MILKDKLIILIAPNVSEQMGGEAIKALQIFQELKKKQPSTIQVTHERNEPELSSRLKLKDVYYVRDTWLALLLWRSVIFSWFINIWFAWKAVALAETIAADMGFIGHSVVIWQTEPNSPVLPRILSRLHINAFGPINGNIYYPNIFRQQESLKTKLRRILHMPLQRLNRVFFNGITKADLIFCAGGDRTRDSLLMAGCPPNKLVDSLDCGIEDQLLTRQRVIHKGLNPRFIHFGRLVFHKCTFLIIESLMKTKNSVVLDIVGQGQELDRCKQLAQDLGVENRVNFLDWYTDHNELFDSFKNYRGMVLPSIEDANGIVVQEVMAMGLPAICLNWGGPQLLISHKESGYLVEPISVDHITSRIAEYMDKLAEDEELAEKMSLTSRHIAEEWRWSQLVNTWCEQIANMTSS